MAGIDDLEAAFRFLRPLCVLVTQNHDKGSVCSLKEVLNSRALNVDFLQELQEYVAFPLRLVLKQFALKWVVLWMNKVITHHNLCSKIELCVL